MVKRIYVVAWNKSTGQELALVRAASAAQAIHHVVDPLFTAKVATQNDLVDLAKTHTVKEA